MKVYEEKIPMLNYVIAIMTISAIIILIILISQFTSKAIPVGVVLRVLLVIIFLFNLVVLISFRRLTITVIGDILSFGFGRFRAEVNLKDIIAVEIEDYVFSKYYGYGIRMGRDGTLGYVPKGGQGLRIAIRGNKRAYFFITDHAPELKNILEKYLR